MFFFLSSIRRHTRCALVTGVQTCALRSVKYRSPDCPPVLLSPHTRGATMALELEVSLFGDAIGTLALVDGRLSFRYAAAWLDRKSVVEGKSVSVRVDLGGCGIIKKEND